MLKPKPRQIEEQAIPRLQDSSEYLAASAQLAALRQRAEETEARRQRAIARMRGDKAKRSVTERASDLLKGGTIPAGNPADELSACNAEDKILFPAMAEAQAKIDDIASGLAFEMSQRVRDRHNDCLRAALQAMAELHGAIADALAIQNELRAAGHHPASHVLPLPIPHAAAILGSPDNFNSPAAAFKRQLETLGVL